MQSLILLLKVSRPLGWVVAPLVFVIGFYYSNSYLTLLSIVQIILLSFPFSIILYGINDLYDYDSDRLNPRKKILNFNEEERVLIKRVSILVFNSFVTKLNCNSQLIQHIEHVATHCCFLLLFCPPNKA